MAAVPRISPHVLLLGGHGKVAMLLTPLLLARNWNVTSVVRNPEHEPEILNLGKGQKGKVEVLLSSLEEVKQPADAKKILDTVKPDYVVWSAGAGGKGGPERTYAIDQDAAKHFINASFSYPSVTKFLLISHLGSRRNKARWMSDEDWAHIVHLDTQALPTYARAKLEADEYFTALAAKRKKEGGHFQAINLRPGLLDDNKATGKVQLGHTRAVGTVSREDVAIVADRLLARADTEGWIDLMEGDEPVDEAIERVVREKIDAVEGEDVEAMIKRFS
ncbi:hypothetical protein DTO166G4_6584 [Paecilomyces variotii]|nr:hypothetical protein DTO032I3_5493 [Paecilomyces variotii]KAJ9211811.1 hypothetical protein DTO166G4_6584 [Paecilomyces variotii]KAJ9231186.1 hypothetical protein DTO169E5_8074 [Paecilomyces variotii]KAJ9236500.1 hypothetical protein DTO166G5_3965 [Paecilomyces variotii]KAJ9256405.1 hypothetical protein DTO195F2_5813 [Paecilomyces variotii]